MAFNLIDAAKNLLPNDLTAKAASFLGESEGGIQKALSGAIPAVLAGLLSKSSSGGSGILDMVKGAAGTGILGNLGNLLDGGATGSGIGSTVMGWLRSIFGDKLNNITNAISGFAGIKPSSANTVLSMAAPAAMAPIGRYAEEKNLRSDELGSFLQSQKSSILSTIPSGFNLAGALGLGSLGDIGSRITSGVSNAGDYAADTVRNVGSSGNKWLWPLLLLVALAVLIWFFTQRGCKDAATTTTEDTTSTTIAPEPAPVDQKTTGGMLDTVTGNYVYNTGNEIELKLNDGTTLRVGENSTEAKLYKMLTDAGFNIDTADKTKNWVTFDRVYFETGKSVLTSTSQTQVQHVASILKNFPSASIKIGGYTDNTGDAAVNKKISGERAKIVMNELVKLGAKKNQVTEAVGYGPDHPVCAANDTPECKAQNRRVDLKVAGK